MKDFLILIATLTITGCATYVNKSNGLTQSQMNSMGSYATQNGSIWGEYGLKNKEDYSHITLEKYESLLNKPKSDGAQAAQEFYNSTSDREIVACKNTFIICGYSQRYTIAFCDNTENETIEQFEVTSSPIVIPDLKTKIMATGVCK